MALVRVYVRGSSLHELNQARAWLRAAKGKLRNRRAVHAEAESYMAERWAENFDSEGGIYGAWPELSEWSIDERGSAHPILIRRGDLWASFSEQNESATITEESTEWNFFSDGNSWPVQHHFGYPNPLGASPIPARKLWDINEADEDEIQRMFEVWLEAVFAGG